MVTVIALSPGASVIGLEVQCILRPSSELHTHKSSDAEPDVPVVAFV